MRLQKQRGDGVNKLKKINLCLIIVDIKYIDASFTRLVIFLQINCYRFEIKIKGYPKLRNVFFFRLLAVFLMQPVMLKSVVDHFLRQD